MVGDACLRFDIRRADANIKAVCFPARCRSWSKICSRCVSLFQWRACGVPAGGHMGPPLHRRKLHTPQGGFSWPFGPIHLLVRFRLAAKASSFRCFDSPHATRCAAVGGFAALRMRPTPCGYFTGLARGPHNSPPCQRGQGTPKIINSQLSIPNS